MAERLIHILPEQVASQIAAGEVVERPASAVKEMVENSLDAGARSISVEIERGGLGLIAVADDGSGMGPQDALLSLRRHATSKIRDAADLQAIRTLGFRGEALASVASVSRLLLKTRRAADPNGVELMVVGGEVQETRACAMAAGTRIEVRDLFFNTPARLKFMKTLATEQGAVGEALQRLALANHRVAIRCAADGRVLFDLPRASTVVERVRQVFGAKVADRMLAFESGDAALRVHGLLAMSQESYATARMIFAFVNGRAVRDRLIVRAITQAYQTLMPRGRHPAVLLFVEMRPSEVDVNVHPMKTEVRFRRSGAVFEIVYHALRARLADQAACSSSAGSVIAAAASAAAPGSVAGSGSVAAPMMAANAAAAEQVADVPAALTDLAAAFTDAARVRIVDEAARPLRLVADATVATRPAQRPLGLGFERTRETSFGAANGGSAPFSAAGERNQAAAPVYSQLRILGQLFAGYIALEDDDGLLLVDQHAAHERVTFEKLRAELRDGGVQVQALLTPMTLELNPARAAQVLAALAELRALGFEVEAFGPATLLLKGAPAVFGADGGFKLLSEMIDNIGDGSFRLRGEASFEDGLKLLACHGSVRVGRALSVREIEELLKSLDQTDFKTNCPHGRPVHIRFGRGQIERMFRR